MPNESSGFGELSPSSAYVRNQVRTNIYFETTALKFDKSIFRKDFWIEWGLNQRPFAD